MGGIVFLSGWLYRRAINLKDAGERLRWGWLIRLGLRLRDWVLDHGKIK
jgi:hypothetical protein